MAAEPEYELKARLEDDGRALRSRLEAGGWERVFAGEMKDRRFDSPDGSLSARDEVLRIRSYTAEGSAEGRAVLTWKGPTGEEQGFKLREEIETELGDPASARGLLDRLGFGEVTMSIDRRIELYRKGPVSVRIERYPGMDTLAEVEGPPPAVEERIPELGVPRDAWKAWPLPRFVERYEARTGREARLAAEEEPW